MTIEEAVRLAKQNNSEGQAYLYDQTYKKSYYVALKYMVNEDDARDVVQDAYIRAFRSIGQLDDVSKFEKWINQIVANTAKNALKKKKPDLFTDVAGDEEYDVADRFEADPSQQPEVVMDQKETARLVQEIISELSDEQRTCVMMYYFQGMQVKEISSTLEVSDNTVKSRLNYARKSIEAKVKELEKKGTKLYALAPIPFFVFLLHTEADACEAGALAGLYSASGAGNAASAGNAATGATSTASIGGAGAAATGLSLGAKIAIGIISAVVVIGGAIGVGVAVYNSTDDNNNTNYNANNNTMADGQVTEESSQSEYDDLSEYTKTQSYVGDSGKAYSCDFRTYPANSNEPWEIKPSDSSFYGKLGYYIADFDGDGEDELLTFSINSDFAPVISISELVKGKVVQSDSKVLDGSVYIDGKPIDLRASLGTSGYLNCFIYPMNGKLYIGVESEDTINVYANGTDDYNATFSYENGVLTPIYYDGFTGSDPDITYWPEEANRYNANLKKAGFDFDANALVSTFCSDELFSDLIKGSQKVCGFKNVFVMDYNDINNSYKANNYKNQDYNHISEITVYNNGSSKK